LNRLSGLTRPALSDEPHGHSNAIGDPLHKFRVNRPALSQNDRFRNIAVRHRLCSAATNLQSHLAKLIATKQATMRTARLDGARITLVLEQLERIIYKRQLASESFALIIQAAELTRKLGALLDKRCDNVRFCHGCIVPLTIRKR
jgi:hypothetical protein